MKIYGIGTDVVNINRIKKSIRNKDFISRLFNNNEIIVHNIKSGKPHIKLLGNTKKVVIKILNKKKFNIFLSLSDDKPFAVATVVISI